MEKASLYRWQIVLSILLALVAARPALAQSSSWMDPEAGYQVREGAGDTMEASKLRKLNENLRQGALEFRAANFEAAIKWYEGALQLDPENAAIKQQLATAREMAQARQALVEKIPAGRREREQFLDAALASAQRYLEQEEYDKAAQAFHTLWLSAGDYQNKTLRLYAQARSLAAAGPAAQIAQLSDRPAAGEDLLARARQAAAAGQTDTARRLLEQLLEREPLNNEARQELARLAAPAAAQAPVTQTVAPSPVAPAAQVAPVAPLAPAAPVAPALSAAAQLELNRLLVEAEQALAAADPAKAHQLATQALAIDAENAHARQLLESVAERGYDPRGRVADLIAIGDKLLAEERYEEAIQTYQEALRIEPTSRAATVALERAQRQYERAAAGAARELDAKERQRADALLRLARKHYEANELVAARDAWGQVLQIDPQNKMAQTWLEMTEPAWRNLQEMEASQVRQLERSAEAERLLSAPITISTEREIPLSEFMSNLGYTTPVELQFYIAEGADVLVMANFQDVALRTVLDTILPPKGLTWSIDQNNVVTIAQEVVARTYKLTQTRMAQVRALLEANLLQQNVWGQVTPPSAAIEIRLDERLNMLIVTGSQIHIQRIENFLESLPETLTPEMESRFYKIREQDGPRILSLINSLIQVDSATPFDLERKAFVDRDDLIIRDTPENLTRIEELLLDQDFIQMATSGRIDLENFSLVPRDIEDIQSDYIQPFTARVVEAISVFLYAETGQAQAAREGRRLWFDESTLQLTIVDTPANLTRVREYLNSLPELRTGPQREVIFLEFAEADTLAPSLERIMNLTTGAAGGASGQSITITLSRGQQREFMGATFRVMRVEQNDPQDRRDDQVELSINSPGLGPQQTSLQELTTTQVGDFEITAEDVLPSAGVPGEGRARLSIRYIPQIVQQQIQQQASQFGIAGVQLPGQAAPDEAGITINPFTELNAIILRWENPELYQEAVSLIRQLDKPIKQVEIETMFVQVNETRAKEFSADFNIAGLGSGRTVDWDTNAVNTRFAQSMDEFRDPFGPTPFHAANLIQGTTMVNAVFGTIPNVQWQLRLLEAEGILNVVNGPKVVALHGEEAEFRIESYLPQQVQETQNALVNIINPISESYQQNFQLATQEEQVNNPNMFNAVVLRVVPSITSERNIVLRELTAELLDLDTTVMPNLITPIVTDVPDVTENQFFTPIVAPQAVTGGVPAISRKKIVTDARIANGGTIVLGGWTGERSSELTSGVPVLRNMPYLGKLLFSRAQRSRSRTTLLIFLTGWIVNTEG